MTEYVLFVPKDPDEVILDQAIVTVFDASGSPVAGPLRCGAQTIDLDVSATLLAPGTYTLWVRAHGYRFPFLQELVVVEDDGPTADDPKIVDMVASALSSDPALAPGGWASVYGWCGVEVGGRTPLRRHLSYGIVERLPSGRTLHSARAVQLILIGSVRDGESPSLAGKETWSISVDANGYWETLVLPETVYGVSIPGVPGIRLFISPEAGVQASVEDQVDASLGVAPYELFAGIL